MAGIYIYSEDAVLAKEMVTLAKELAQAGNQPIGAITLCEDAAKELAALGVAKVIVLKGNSTWAEAYEEVIADTLAAEGASVVLVGGTVSGKCVAAKVAARLDAGLATEATKVSLDGEEVVIERIIYGGLAVSTESISFPAFVTIAPHSYDIGAADGNGEVTVKEVSVDPKVVIGEVAKIERQGVDLVKADKVISIGRGAAKDGVMDIVNALADAVGAEVGCTRPVAEDVKLLPIERYIGISGKMIKGSLYIGVGVSGQIQHVSGIRDAKIIVAINSDENAPIFAAADYGIVGDYAAIVPALTAAVQAAK